MSIIKSFLEKGILISPEIMQDPLLVEKLSKIEVKHLEEGAVINKTFLKKIKLISEDPEEKLKKEGGEINQIKIISSYNKEPGKITVNDFITHFNKRFGGLASFLRQRQELQDITSIQRLKTKVNREKVSLLGMVYAKRTTKNNNILLTLEDPTGTINVIVSGKKRELFDIAKEIVLDEVIGITGFLSGNFIFVNQIITPGVPFKELKKGPEEEYVAFLGDPHFGSKAFLKKEFNDFFKWINQEKGNAEQKEIASKVKYLVMIGDLVEGVGIYPNQERDLEIKDIKEQYDLLTQHLKKIPKHITILICPGNHDVGRISEPQQPLLHQYAVSLQTLPNTVLLSNPALINIGATQQFSGFDMLLYHGYSLIYYADNVESIRSKGGQKRPDLIMKLLLQKRHLAPTHTSNLYIPDAEFDPLIIEHVPDFFITGHIHRTSVDNYKNITLINCSCWTGITEDTEKRGLVPQPAKVPLVNLKTREVKIINFLTEKDNNESIK